VAAPKQHRQDRTLIPDMTYVTASPFMTLLSLMLGQTFRIEDRTTDRQHSDRARRARAGVGSCTHALFSDRPVRKNLALGAHRMIGLQPSSYLGTLVPTGRTFS
jgi:hypothetical protein